MLLSPLPSLVYLPMKPFCFTKILPSTLLPHQGRDVVVHFQFFVGQSYDPEALCRVNLKFTNKTSWYCSENNTRLVCNMNSVGTGGEIPCKQNQHLPNKTHLYKRYANKSVGTLNITTLSWWLLGIQLSRSEKVLKRKKKKKEEWGKCIILFSPV